MNDMNQLESMIYANLYARSICDGVGHDRAMGDAEDAIRRMREVAADRARMFADMDRTSAAAESDIVKSMIDARARLANGRAIDARWCLYPQQAMALMDVGAIQSYSGKGLFRGEEIVVRDNGGYVFNAMTGERRSIDGEP